MILAGDVGGTKTVLALCDGGRAVREVEYASADYAALDAIVDEFLAQPAAIDGACFGVAGVVAGETARITNLPWTIDARTLAARIGAPVLLLNDLQATALGALALPATSFATLQAGARAEPEGTIAVLAPGTGLGEAILVFDGVRYRALPSEGGHADFAPATDEEYELLRFLRARHGEHVSNERILSGDGIGDLYDFVCAARGEPADIAAGDDGDRNAAISRAALAGANPAAAHALALFASILGAEAGNHALHVLATGGVAIGGGIAPKILPLLQTGALLDRFNAKGRFSGWMRERAVRVILEPRGALLGAALAATHAQRSP